MEIKNILERVNKTYRMELKNGIKKVCKDTYNKKGNNENLENYEYSLPVSSALCDFNGLFYIKEDYTSDNIKELILNYFASILNYSKITELHFTNNNGKLILNIYENDECEAVENIKEYMKDGRDLYSCYYEFDIYINDIPLEQEELECLFNFI